MISKHFFCFVVFFINLKCIPASETYKSIIWDPENPLFFTGNSATCSNKYRRLKVQSASRIKFICPNVATVLQTTSEEVSKTNKYENLWLLSNRESFDKCDTTLDINVTKPLFQCTNPTQLEFYRITFQRYAALPDEQVFKQGNSYYIIATSNGKQSHINDTSGGHCNDTNVSMKIEVYVCNNTEQVKDEMCKEGVGELTCPDDSSVSTPTPSSAHVTMMCTPSEATATQTPTPTTVTTTSSTLSEEATATQTSTSTAVTTTSSTPSEATATQTLTPTTVTTTSSTLSEEATATQTSTPTTVTTTSSTLSEEATASQTSTSTAVTTTSSTLSEATVTQTLTPTTVTTTSSTPSEEATATQTSTSTAVTTTSSTPSEATATQTLTPTTVTTTPTASVSTTDKPDTTTKEEGDLGSKCDSNGDNERIWMITAFVFIGLFLVTLIASGCYIFCVEKKQKIKTGNYEKRKLEPSQYMPRKNPAFDNGLAEHKTGSLPDAETGK